MNPRCVLFICTGNTCRSPMAEHLFRARMPGTSGWTAESAGVSAAGSMPASTGAQAVLEELGIDAHRHRSRALTSELVDRADMLVVMTQAHRAEVMRRFPSASDRVRVLSSFETGGHDRDIFDPVGQSVGGYRRCRDEISRAVYDMVLTLMKGAAAAAERKGNRA